MPVVKEAKSYNIQEKPEVIHHVMKLGRGDYSPLIAQSASLVANPTSWASAVRRTNVQLGQRIIAGPRIN